VLQSPRMSKIHESPLTPAAQMPACRGEGREAWGCGHAQPYHAERYANHDDSFCLLTITTLA
jgi:hypothetical protein